MGTSWPGLVDAHSDSSAEDEMPAQLKTAPNRNTAQRIGAARTIQLDELYAAADADLAFPSQKLLDLEVIERRAVRNAQVVGAGAAITTTLHEGDDVEERLTILTSLTRGDRVAAAVYSVRVVGGLTSEFPVTGRGLARLAAHVAATVL
jgi:hypothetical protein